MSATPTLPPLREVIERYGLSARKALGQHFLLDGNITDKIVRLAGTLEDINAVEIGPGPGGLTRSLLRSGASHVYAVERDDRCIAALQELREAFGDRLTLYAEDAMKFSVTTHVPAPRAIIANLPYNIGTLLLMQWLDEIASQGPDAYQFLTLMFQKEVADRIVADPGSKSYGRVSVITQWLCEVHTGFHLPASAFSPPPKVDSSVIHLIPRKAPLYPCSKEALEKVVATAFGQRRKMLRSSLSSLVPQAEAWLTAAGITPTRRPETLSIQEFGVLAASLPGHPKK